MGNTGETMTTKCDTCGKRSKKRTKLYVVGMEGIWPARVCASCGKHAKLILSSEAIDLSVAAQTAARGRAIKRLHPDDVMT